MRLRTALIAALLAVASAPHVARAAQPLTLVVDAREVSRNVLHVSLDVPIAGGPTVLVFPKWIPGEHSPANPINDLLLLEATASGSRVAWTRDPIDPFTITFAAPANATTLTLRFDAAYYENAFQTPYSTGRLALVNWYQTLFYPAGSLTTPVAASLIVPAGWQTATALDGPVRTGDRIDFKPVSVERLLDSPVMIGANTTSVPLTPDAELDVASDSPVAPVVDPKVKDAFAALVTQAETLFGSHHWRAPYHFLVTASDAIHFDGLEHHESSWNAVDTDTLATPSAAKRYAGDLLTHEFTHSWNGKYRRPAGLVRADYQLPETTDLLWVYEGLTEYYGDVLAVRAGFWTPADYRTAIAAKYARLDAKTGRIARSLADTTFDEQLDLTAGPHATFDDARRMTEDYYDESELMWLDADTLIRDRSHGRASLDDFARAFFGAGGTSGPAVLPYTRADVVATLAAVLPYDWERFFHDRLDVPTPHPPLDGITRGGYTFGYAATVETPISAVSVGAGSADDAYGLGATVAGSGAVADVRPGSAAARGGLVPGMTIVAIDGQRFSRSALTATIARDATSHAPMTLLVTNHQAFATLSVAYDGGPKLPLLTRAGGQDLIGDIVRAR